jgi:hypothetical protein
MFSNARFMLAVALFSLLTMRALPEANNPVSISPDKLEFPAQSADGASQPQNLTLTNRGSSSVKISSILISGIDFSQSNNCDKPLASGADCSIEVRFHPATSGTRLGALQIAWSGGTRPRTIPLTGIAP